MPRDISRRDALLTGLAAASLPDLAAGAQSASTRTPFVPAVEPKDAWLDEVPGKHRVLLDVTSPKGMPDGIRFAGNIFNGHKSGYAVDEKDVVQVLCLRHYAMPFALTDAVWSVHGPALAKILNYTDPRGGPAPTANPFNSGERKQLADLTARGVRFMVCETASRSFSRALAGQGGDVDAMFKLFSDNLIPQARYVSAGVVGVAHAQEHGYALLFVG